MSDEVVDINQVQPFLRFNQYIKHGYRKPMGPTGCCRSLCYLHNESSNIWLHLYGVFYLSYCIFGLYGQRDGEHDAYLAGILGMVLFMFIGSVIYHTFMPTCRTLYHYELLLKFDVVAALLGMTGSAHSFIMLSYRCSPSWYPTILFLFFLGISVYTIKTCIFSRNVRDRLISIGSFLFLRVIIGTVASIPRIIHLGISKALVYHWVGFLFVFLGGVVNYLRFPEKYFPGKFDYTIHSHGLWHLFGLIATFLVHLATLADLEDWDNTVCS